MMVDSNVYPTMYWNVLEEDIAGSSLNDDSFIRLSRNNNNIVISLTRMIILFHLSINEQIPAHFLNNSGIFLKVIHPSNLPFDL